MSETAALKAYRDGLRAAGRLLEARAVTHCIKLLQRKARESKPGRQIGAGSTIATPAATMAPADVD